MQSEALQSCAYTDKGPVLFCPQILEFHLGALLVRLVLAHLAGSESLQQFPPGQCLLPKSLLLKCVNVAYDSGAGGTQTGMCVLGSARRAAAGVSSCEWAHV